ncbi:MAG: tRNA(Ile)-lysidine synthetase [Gammaproteobacteria bacterium]|nr:tRNA(Ile)-lysidine synthetase [Gammaproteobacteria bacterium]
MDSHVLLHSMVNLKDDLTAPISAVHVNHGISSHAGSWARHCREICSILGVKLDIIEIDARCPPGESPESWARRKRYAVLTEHIGEERILLTAHHKDDQAETLLLQLFRGAGPAGLAAMPVTQSFGQGWHCRPLLDFSRLDLRQYALQHDLHWIEDESNQDTGFDRNYIRHQLFPVIKQHWPGVITTLARASQHQAEVSELQDQLARLDLAGIADADSLVKINNNILKSLNLYRQKNVLRYWLHLLQLPLPDAGHMHHIIEDVVNSGADATPCVTWPGAEVRRYREYLYAATPLSKHDPEQIITWDLEQPLTVLHGRLFARLGQGQGIKASHCRNNSLEIRYRSGGETIQPAGRDYHHELKKLLQDQGVPPWLRDRIPLLYINGRLAAVPGKWIAQEFIGQHDEPSWQIRWEGMERIFPV